MNYSTEEVWGAVDWEGLAPGADSGAGSRAADTANLGPKVDTDEPRDSGSLQWAHIVARRDSGASSWDIEEALPPTRQQPRLETEERHETESHLDAAPQFEDELPQDEPPRRQYTRVGTMALLRSEFMSLIDDNAVVCAINRLLAASPGELAAGFARSLLLIVAVGGVLFGATRVIASMGSGRTSPPVKKAAVEADLEPDLVATPAEQSMQVEETVAEAKTSEVAAAKPAPKSAASKPTKKSKRGKQMSKRHKRSSKKKKASKRRSSRRRR